MLFINLIQQIPEVREYVKYGLENNESRYIDFVSNFLDIELLNAYLTHRSIDQVITFIVHDQNTQRITPELYATIKTKTALIPLLYISDAKIGYFIQTAKPFLSKL